MKKFVIAVTLALAIFGLSGCSCVKTILCKTKNCEKNASCRAACNKVPSKDTKEKNKHSKDASIKKPAADKKSVVKEESAHLHTTDKQ